MIRIFVLSLIVGTLSSCTGSSGSSSLSPSVNAALQNYVQATSNAENAAIAMYRPHLRQSDIDECRAREEMLDYLRQGTQRLLLFHDCLSAAANRNQGH